MIQIEETSDREGEGSRKRKTASSGKGARPERGLISPDPSARGRAWGYPRGAHHAWGEGLGEGRREGGRGLPVEAWRSARNPVPTQTDEWTLKKPSFCEETAIRLTEGRPIIKVGLLMEDCSKAN
jgi:hypothetical protein